MKITELITEHMDVWTAAQTQKSNGGRGRGRNGNGQSSHGIKKLRELILELAVRGKLVPQDPNDEPASVLLERIAKEKKRLIKKGKIKKEKALSVIVEDEKLVDLPFGWSFTRLGNLINLVSGQHLKPQEYAEKSEDGMVPYLTGPAEFGDQYPLPTRYTHEKRAIAHKSDILITCKGSGVGKVNIADSKIAISRQLMAIQIFFVNQKFAKLLVQSLNTTFREKIVGIAIPGISREDVTDAVIKAPPLPEQQRIVAKVDELMALCDQLYQQQTDSNDTHQTLMKTLLATLAKAADPKEFTQAWQRIADHFDTLFTTEQSIDQLKQTLLQLAVMGKLVPQDPNDEPASVLLEKIAGEKKRLIKEGKIRKEKPLPVINENEKPFALPTGWGFARLERIVDITSGVTMGRKLAGRKLVSVPYLRVANVQRGFLELDLIKDIDIPEDEIKKFTVVERDLLITEGGDWDKVGRTAIWRGELPLIVHQNHVFKARLILKEQNEVWIEKYLNSSLAREYFERSSKQTTNLASINKTQLRGCIIAIPPLAEQRRIVAKGDELMALCDELKARLNAAQSTQIQLADAIVEKAVA